jgi:ABC-type molybdate transport system permease subunit
MNLSTLLFGIAILIAGVFSIATSSIAIECYNKNEGLKNEKQANFTYLVINLISAIVMVLAGFASMFFGVTM